MIDGLIPFLRKHATASHGLRYLAGAVLCALATNAIYIGGDRAGLSTLTNVLLAWVAGGSIGYLWHHRISFRSRPSWLGFGQMMAGSALAIPLAWGVISLLQHHLQLSIWLAAPAATVIMFAYNYCNARLAILRRLFRSAKDPISHD